MQKLIGTPWESMWNKTSATDKKDLFFIINHHMGLSSVGFGKRLSNLWIDDNGKYKNLRKIKLLTILIIMDRLGRGVADPKGDAQQGLEDMQSAADDLLKRRNKRGLPSPDDPREFIRLLANKPISVIRRAFVGKFGREPNPDEF